MRPARLTGVAAAALVVATSAAAAVAEDGAVRAVIDRAYRVHDNDRRVEKLYDPALRRAIQADIDATPKGDEQNLDYDPICQCQDDAGLSHRILSSTVTAASATVVVENAFEDKTKVRVIYHLRRFGQTWLIDDIETGDVKSLKVWLETQPH